MVSLEGERDQQKNTLDIWAPLAKPFMFLERLRSPSLIETDNITEPLWDKWKCFSLPRKKQTQKKHSHGCQNAWSHTETTLSISLYNHNLNSPLRDAEDGELLSNAERSKFQQSQIAYCALFWQEWKPLFLTRISCENDTLHESKSHLRFGVPKIASMLFKKDLYLLLTVYYVHLNLERKWLLHEKK